MSIRNILSSKRKIVPYDGTIFLRSWSAKERIMMSELFTTDDKSAEKTMHMLAKVCVQSICDESGVLQFTDEDIPALLETDLDIINISNAVLAQHTPIETAKKNS